MAVETYDFRRPQDFLFNNSLIEFKNGSVSLRLMDDFSRSIIDDITATSSTGTGLDKISDNDPSTFYLDTSAGPQSQITWDFGEVVNLTKFQFTLTQDPRLWDLAVVETTLTDFSLPTNSIFLYASGTPALLGAFPGTPTATDPNIALTTVVKNLSTRKQGAMIRITLQASAMSPDAYRYLTDFKVYVANYTTSNPPVTSSTIIDTKDLTTLVDTTTTPTGTSIGYTILADGQEWWFDGFNWARSNGTYEQSSSIASLMGKLSMLLPQKERSRVQAKFYLHTSVPANTPTISTLDLSYDDTAPLVNVPITRMTGIVRNAFGDPVVGATVTATFVPKGANTYTLNGVRIANPDPRSTTTSSTGHFSISVVPTDNMIPTSGLMPADAAKWQIAVNGPGIVDIKTGIVNSVEEVDVYNDSFGS